MRAIVLLKFEEMEPLADWFADRLADVVRENRKALEADVIVPVPLHKNQAARARLEPGRNAVRTTCEAT